MNIYRSHDGMILGVCKGLAESLGIPPKYLRILFILGAVIFKVWYVLAIYLLAALLLPRREEEEWKIGGNFDSLGSDARRRFREEYAEFAETLSRKRPEKDDASARDEKPEDE